MTYHNSLVNCSFYISPGISSYGVTSPQKAHGVFLEIEAAPSVAFHLNLSQIQSLCSGLDDSTLSPFLLLPGSPGTARFHLQAHWVLSCGRRLWTQQSLPPPAPPPAFPRARAQLIPFLLPGRCSDSTLKEPWLLTPEDHSVSFHGFITLFVLCCHLEPYPFVCLLALSLPRRM